MCGRVVNIARKTPADPNVVAWNVAQGGRFDNCRWDDWSDAVCRVALKAAAQTKLDYTGVDVMVDEDGRAWFIEANSAPSLPFNEDGSTTYRHQCVAKGLKYHIENGFDQFDVPSHDESGWRTYVHPAIWSRRTQ
jgi:hypothetical protein